MYCVPTNSEWIRESNIDFSIAIKNSIDDKNMLEKVKLFMREILRLLNLIATIFIIKNRKR